MGRPPKSPDEKRSLRLPQPRVTVAEMMKIEESAATLGLSVSEFIVRRAVDYRLPSRNLAELEHLLLEVNRIGVNLNQIAKHANATGDISAAIIPTASLVSDTMARIVAAMGDDPDEP